MKKEFEIGQIIFQPMNGVRGILLAHEWTPHNSYYEKAVIYCFFAPHNKGLCGRTLKLSVGDLKVLP